VGTSGGENASCFNFACNVGFCRVKRFIDFACLPERSVLLYSGGGGNNTVKGGRKRLGFRSEAVEAIADFGHLKEGEGVHKDASLWCGQC